MAATSLLLGLSYFVPILLIFSLLGYALLVTGIALDFVITPSPESLQVIRKVNPKLSLGDDNEIQIHIRNMRKQKIKGTIADNVPLTFQRRDTLFNYSDTQNSVFCFVSRMEENGKGRVAVHL